MTTNAHFLANKGDSVYQTESFCSHGLNRTEDFCLCVLNRTEDFCLCVLNKTKIFCLYVLNKIFLFCLGVPTRSPLSIPESLEGKWRAFVVGDGLKSKVYLSDKPNKCESNFLKVGFNIKTNLW